MVKNKLEWALWLASIGFPVFLIRENTKLPRSEGWQQQATRDPARIAELWALYPNDNVGCACGAGDNPLSVVDLDVKAEKDGRVAWATLGPTPPTLTFRTASGGLHLVYPDPSRLFLNTVGQLGPGIDTRGIGGYIVGPGSVIDGKPYTVHDDGGPAL